MTVFMKKLKTLWNYSESKTILAAICAHSVSISIGFCQAYSAILIPQLNNSQEIPVNTEQSSWLASFGAITNPIGSITSGFLAELIGRKKSIQFSSLPFIVGWMCIAFATDISWLYAGRLITGIAAGMATASYTYVSEISLPTNRGILQALGPVSASFGILTTYILGYFIQWNMLALITLIFSLFTIITVQFLPESPAFLLSKDRHKECLQSLQWFRGETAAQLEYLQTVNASKKNQANLNAGSTTGGKSLYLSSVTMKPFFILAVIFLLQELSGIYSILFYTVSFFEQANMEIDQYVISIIVGALRLLMSIIAAVLINKIGRKTLLNYSSLGMFLTLLGATIYIKYYEINPGYTKYAPVLPLIFILLSVVFSMVGMLPIPWILVGELFPVEVRSILSGIVICIAQIFIFITVKIYPDMISLLGFSGTLMVFLAASGAQMIFTRVFLPETRNKTLTEISESFKKPKKAQQLFVTTANRNIITGSNNNNNNNNVNGKFQYGRNVFTVSIQ